MRSDRVSRSRSFNATFTVIRLAGGGDRGLLGGVWSVAEDGCSQGALLRGLGVRQLTQIQILRTEAKGLAHGNTPVLLFLVVVVIKYSAIAVFSLTGFRGDGLIVLGI